MKKVIKKKVSKRVVKAKPTPKPKSKPAPTLKEALNIIDELLCHKSISRDLANCLSVVRGPDSSAGTVKIHTTERFRRIMFPKACQADKFGTIYLPWAYAHANQEPDFEGGYDKNGHFNEHVNYALEALKRGKVIK